MSHLKHGRYAHLKFAVALGAGALLALALCVQCVRTYLFTDSVLVPQQAHREAERQAMALGNTARSAGVTDPHALGPVIEHALESAPERVLWMRVLDADGKTVAAGGNMAKQADSKTLVTKLPLRMPIRHHGAAYTVEMAVSLKSVRAAFDGLRKNLIIGLAASIALLLAVALIGLRAPQYLRGKYLEGELELARRVQNDLQPKSRSLSEDVSFAASSVAADHVGGDFYDVFEAGPGKTAMVLGDVSGKGVPAALLVSVLQGAIRCSTATRHESACERMNRMLCELTARERFATLFWGVFDAATGTLRYVNAGHAAPMLVRREQGEIERLETGGPVLGVLPSARYTAGTVRIEPGDTLLLYSDGVNEAANQHEEEFGEDRLREIIADAVDPEPEELCERIMDRVAAFANGGPAPDDRTLLVVRFEPVAVAAVA